MLFYNNCVESTFYANDPCRTLTVKNHPYTSMSIFDDLAGNDDGNDDDVSFDENFNIMNHNCWQ